MMVIFTKGFKTRSVFYLTALIFTFSLNLLQYLLVDLGIISYLDLYRFIYLPWATIYPVFLYLYIFTLLNSDQKIAGKWNSFYVPFIIFSVLIFIIRIWTFMLPEMDEYAYYHWYDPYEIIVEIFSIFFTLLILYLSYQQILEFEKTNKPIGWTNSPAHLRYLKVTLLLIAIIIIPSWIYYTLMELSHESPNYYVLWIALSLIIFWLGHMGIYNFGIQRDRMQIKKFERLNPVVQKVKKQENIHLEKLQKLIIEEKKYRDPVLSLESIANEMNLSKSYLSRLINSELDTTFNEFVNQERINEVKRYLENDEFKNYTLVAMGLEAGFSSKTTFYTIFKKYTGMTPSEFKQNLKSQEKT